MLERFSALLLVFLAASLLPTVAAADIAPDLEAVMDRAASGTRIPVIVRLAGRVDIGAHRHQTRVQRRALVSAWRANANRSLPPLKSFLRDNGAHNVRDLWLINGVSAALGPAAIERLSRFPRVAEVRLDETLRIPDPIPALSAPAEWNIDRVHAVDIWNLGFDGSGIVIAGMDSGVDYQHADLAGRWRGGSNSWYDPNGEHPDLPADKDGHGTGTMALMVGGDAGGSSIGVAPGARWIAVKIFDDAGIATESGIHLGFQWLLDPDDDPNTDDAPHVVNNSWGYPDLVDTCYLEFEYDLQALEAAGIAAVFSAGNSGPNAWSSISPANNPSGFAVGAVSADLSIADFSSRGPSACVLENDFFPEVTAPGVNIKTADLTSGGVFPAAFTYVSGTSYAAPHVSGAMALLLQAFPNLAPADLKAVLGQSALDLGAPGADNEYGHGMIDVLAAYRSLVPCVDADSDGYFAAPSCGTPQDCNDADAGLFPGAVEIKHDGVDQDCNGYDLTIEIQSAVYRADASSLFVAAASSLGAAADLVLQGFGPMIWNPDSNRWEILVAGLGANPGQVVVSGIEGAESAATTVCTNICAGDLNDDGVVNFADLTLLRSNFGTDCSLLAPEAPCIGDLTGDRHVDFADLTALRADFGRGECLVCQ